MVSPLFFCDHALVEMLTSYQGAVGKGPRYAVYDFEYQLKSGEGTRYVGAPRPTRTVVPTDRPHSETKSPSSPGHPMMLASWSVPTHTPPPPFPITPTDTPQAKMVYASSKEALKRALPGIATELQANDADDIEFDTVIKAVSKGTAA